MGWNYHSIPKLQRLRGWEWISDFIPHLTGPVQEPESLVKHIKTIFVLKLETFDAILGITTDNWLSMFHRMSQIAKFMVLSAPDGPHVGPMNLAIRGKLFTPQNNNTISCHISRFRSQVHTLRVKRSVDNLTISCIATGLTIFLAQDNDTLS